MRILMFFRVSPPWPWQFVRNVDVKVLVVNTASVIVSVVGATPN